MNTDPRIEFFGLPGVGKTFLMQNLISRHPDITPFILPNRPATWSERLRDFPYYLTHPSLIYHAHQTDQKQALMTRFKRIARRRAYIAKSNHCILNECGLVQPLLEAYILWDEQKKVNWEAQFKRVIFNHTYVLLSDKLETIIQRELARTPRRFDMSSETLQSKYQKGQLLIEQMKPHMHVLEYQISDFESTDHLADEIYQTALTIVCPSASQGA